MNTQVGKQDKELRETRRGGGGLRKPVSPAVGWELPHRDTQPSEKDIAQVTY